MRIVQIIDKLNIGGAERILVTLANLFHQKGHTVVVIILLKPGQIATQLLPGITKKTLNRSWKWNPFKMFQLIQWCRSFDLIHVHSSHNLRYLFLSSYLFRLNKPIIFHEHFGNIVNKAITWHQRLIYPNIIFVGVSQTICNWSKECVRLDPSRVFLLSNIVIRREVILSKIQSSKKCSEWLITSNIHRIKNLEFAISLFATYRISFNARLTIIGQIVDVDYFNEILTLVSDLKISECVSFQHNCIDIQPELAKYDIALHSSVSESGPLVLIEYLAQGIPFLSFRTGEVVQILEHELPECIVDNFEILAWMEKVKYLLCINRSRFRKRSLSLYYQNFSEESYYNKCLDIYQKSLAF